MSKPLSAWIGFVAGCLFTIVIAEMVLIPKVYDRAVKDCVNGRALVTITTDTIYSEP